MLKKLILGSHTISLKAKLAGSVTTSQPQFVTTYVDKSATAMAEDSEIGAFNDMTDVVLLPEPAVGHTRTIFAVNIYNKDTAAVTLTVWLEDSVGPVVITQFKATLQTDEVLTVDGIFDANGNFKTSIGSMPATSLTGTLQAAQFPALTGDVTTTTGSLATTLATVNSNVGSFSAADLTVDAKGRITAVASGASTGTGNLVRSSSPTIVTPTIGDHTNATHNHQNAAGGGQLNASSVFSTGTVPVARLPAFVGDSGSGGTAGLVTAPAAGDANKVYYGDGSWKYPGERVIYPRTASGADGTSINITTIPSTWNHLKLIIEPRTDYGTGSVDHIQISFNSDTTAANYYSQYMYSNGTTVTAGQILGATYTIFLPVSAPCNTAPAGYGAIEITIYNYASASLRRNVTFRSGFQGGTTSGTNWAATGWGVWTNTAAAISSIQIRPGLGTNLKSGTAYTLLGLAA